MPAPGAGVGPHHRRLARGHPDEAVLHQEALKAAIASLARHRGARPRSTVRQIGLQRMMRSRRHGRPPAPEPPPSPTNVTSGGNYGRRRAVHTDDGWRGRTYAQTMSNHLPGFAGARVGHVMHAPVVTCPPETPIQDVARAMAEDHLHAVVVTGIELTPWGVVTALDVAAAAATNATEEVARHVAAGEPVTVNVDTPLSEAARVMVEHQVNHVLVVDADGRPAGIVSTSDVVRRFADIN